ncbi:hypothetical protein GOP47_0017230, partial [Adiantum capillus-veneris]
MLGASIELTSSLIQSIVLFKLLPFSSETGEPSTTEELQLFIAYDAKSLPWLYVLSLCPLCPNHYLSSDTNCRGGAEANCISHRHSLGEKRANKRGEETLTLQMER